MKTIELRDQPLTIRELLCLARSDWLILADDDHSYTLEEADEIEKEVARLGRSARFGGFLKKRGRELGSISLEEIEERLHSQGDSERQSAS